MAQETERRKSVIAAQADVLIAAGEWADARRECLAVLGAGKQHPETEAEIARLGRAEGALVDAVKAWRAS